MRGAVIRAVIFDLDGTLVQTEILKAASYAQAAVELSPALSQAQVMDSFKQLVGLPRQQVAEALLARFGLEAAAQKHMRAFGVRTPWQAFVQVRLRIYEHILSDPETLLAHECPYSTALLSRVRGQGYKTALATMSHCQQAQRVLEALSLMDAFDFIASRDDVELGKPDPEIYRLAARQLGVSPQACLVVEDSAVGVQAALAAGARCLAVTSDYTRDAVHALGALEARWVVDDPRRLEAVADQLLKR